MEVEMSETGLVVYCLILVVITIWHFLEGDYPY